MIACATPAHQLVGSTSSTPIIPPSWSVANWYIDPANVTGCASDSGSGTSATCSAGNGPLLTFQELNVHRWGCIGNGSACPRISRSVTITFLSSQAPDTDPIYIFSAVELGAKLTIQGVLNATTQVATGTLNVVTAKNRNTPQLLNTTFNTTTGAFAVGQLLVNTMHASRAWIYTAGAGSSFNISQPLTASTVPPTLYPTEVTWLNNDTVTAYLPPQINLGAVRTVVEKYDTNFNNQTTIYQLRIIDSAGTHFDATTVDDHVNFAETYSDRKVVLQDGAQDEVASVFQNNFIKGIVGGVPLGIRSGSPFILGGVTGGNGAADELSNRFAGATIDLDAILTGETDVGTALWGTAYIESTYTINAYQESNFTDEPNGGGTQILWGPGSLNAVSTSRIFYPAGATGGAATFKLTGGLTLNGQTKGCIAQPGAATIGACNTAAATGANLDTANGSTTGCLVALGGASFCNYGP